MRRFMICLTISLKYGLSMLGIIAVEQFDYCPEIDRHKNVA